MSLPNYGVLAGKVTAKLDSPAAVKKNPQGKPHYQLLMEANGVKYRVAVNVKSDQKPSDLLFLLSENYKHPILDLIKKLPAGYTKLAPKPNSAALDFIKGNLFKLKDMRIVPELASGPNNDLNDAFNLYIQQAMTKPGAMLYAFGSKWGPEAGKKDLYFDFMPGNGIHDIHMNQGNKGSHAGDNGPYQDGALFIYFPAEKRWVAMFLRFQSQVIKTSGVNADAVLSLAANSIAEEETAAEEAASIKIFAAMVNPKGSAEAGEEFIYLVNTTGHDIDLEGYMIADKMESKEVIHNTVIKAAGVENIKLSGQLARLQNDGGIITLLNSQGEKVDGVAYTAEQASRQGVLTMF